MVNTRTVVVTGAGHGIGESVAKTFAGKGYRVIIAEINPENGERVVSEIRKSGGEAFFHQTDISKPIEVEHLMQMVFQKSGRLDVLVNNAGLSEFHDPLEMSEETWDRILGTNL
jgi:NAD(P)-dependent dehydrogenase (short-subunit alcohol dehydrogenase family)